MLESKVRGCLVIIISWVCLSAQPCIAENIKGGPDALMGLFGRNPAQCRSYNRKSDDITTISKTSFEWCGGSACGAAILSHKRTHDGYTLLLAGRGGQFKTHVKIIDEAAIEIDAQTYVRCGENDIRAGVGLEAPSYGSLTHSTEGAFSAYYAIAAADTCSLRVNRQKAASIVSTAKHMWMRFLKDRNMPPTFGATYEADAERTFTISENSAQYAVREDKAALPDFCQEILNVFGNDGRIFPDLIEEKRQRS